MAKLTKKKTLAVAALVAAVFGGGLLYLSAPSVTTPTPPAHVTAPLVPHPLPPVMNGYPVHPLPPGAHPGGMLPPIHQAPGMPASPLPPAGAKTTAANTAKLAQQSQQTAAITLLQNASKGFAMSVYSFPGPDGLVGIVYQSPSPSGGFLHGLAWVNPTTKLIFLGKILDAKGNVIAEAPGFALHTLRHPLSVTSATASASSSASATATTASVNSANFASPAATKTGMQAVTNGPDIAAYQDESSILEGTSGPILTVFFDPDSVQAYTLFKELSAETHKGLLRVRWVPIAVKGQDSLQRAEYILSAPSPIAALRLNFNQFDVHTRQGGAPLLSNMSMMSQIDQSTAILAILHHPNPLVAFYCNAATTTPLPIYLPQLNLQKVQSLLPKMGYGCS